MKKIESKGIFSLGSKIIFASIIIFGFFVFGGIHAAVTTDVDVSTDTKTTILKDSDGDGLLDVDDPHPGVAEIYIVEDADKNGVVDLFEAVDD